MLCIPGSPALSDFRLKKLHQQLTSRGIELAQISSHFIHLVDLGADSPGDNDQEILSNLLTYGPSMVDT